MSEGGRERARNERESCGGGREWCLPFIGVGGALGRGDNGQYNVLNANDGEAR
jgi:hypothetical protein